MNGGHGGQKPRSDGRKESWKPVDVFYCAVHFNLPKARPLGRMVEATTLRTACTAIAIPIRGCLFGDIDLDPEGIGSFCNILEIDLRYFIHRRNRVATVQEPICKVSGRLYTLNVGTIIVITTTAA